ncbi:MAG: gluconate:H+ symporter [Bacteroidota bacterium]
MEFIPIIIGIVMLIVLIAVVKLDAFISFMLVCLFVGIAGGLSITDTVVAIEDGIGKTLGSLVIILGFGSMVGKLVAESGGAHKITDSLVKRFGLKNIQFSLIVTGFIIGIPLFYEVGFVILVPLVIAIAAQTGLPILYIALPMCASLSVTHGFLPPHPGPTAIASVYKADLGLTLIYGIIVGIPAIAAAKFLLSGAMKKYNPPLLKEFIVEKTEHYNVPSLATCLTVALLPVLLIGGSAIIAMIIGDNVVVDVIGNPAIAMLIAVLAAAYFLGVKTGRSIEHVMGIYASAVSSVATILLIIAGSGSFKEIMIATEVSGRIGEVLGGLGMSPLVMAYIIASLIRVCVGSATVAAMTTAGIMQPLIGISGVSPELLVLATGAGSLTLSHINDGGFWLFKEYFNVSIKETLLSWTLMETTVSIIGFLGVLLLNQFV